VVAVLNKNEKRGNMTAYESEFLVMPSAASASEPGELQIQWAAMQNF
jgi:hypothetical protein